MLCIYIVNIPHHNKMYIQLQYLTLFPLDMLSYVNRFSLNINLFIIQITHTIFTYYCVFNNNVLGFFLSHSQIYTQWANYYLERAKSKRKVVELSTDCRDGLLLAEVIEAVTSFKVPELIKKPKTQQQMVSIK